MFLTGRRSRRNSFSEESQLTIENFGGSQDQINMIGRFDRGESDDRVRRVSNTSAPVQNFPLVQLQPVRSSLSDARSTLQLGYDTDSGSEKQDRDDEKTTLKRQTSVDNVSVGRSPAAMRQHSRDNIDGEISRVKQMATGNYGNGDDYEKPVVRKSSFTQLANPTTWQQQTVHHQHSEDIGKWSLFSCKDQKMIHFIYR